MKPVRVAFITGAGSGIGRAVARLLAERGHQVVIVDLNEAATRAVAQEVEEAGGCALPLTCDVTDEADVRAAVLATEERFGRLDILVCSVGLDEHSLLADTAVEDWKRVMDINVTGAFLCMKHARDVMVRGGFGRMICLGSSSGIYGMGWPAYSAAKAALNGLALSAARELAPFGITVNTVAPGPTATPLSVGLWNKTPGRKEQLESRVPVGRVAQPEEIAAAIGYLTSEEAGFVTGATLVIDGGLTSLMPVPRQMSS